MKVLVEVDLTCNQITEDDKLPFEEGRDEVYFLVASAAGGAQTSAHVPPGEPGYLGFRGDAAATHLHVPLWSGGVDTQQRNLGIIVMEQDNDSLGESGRQSLEALLNTLTKQTGTVGAIASALAPIVKGIISLFANKHDVIGGVAVTLQVDASGELLVGFAPTNPVDPSQATTTANGAAVKSGTSTEAKFKLVGGGSKYDATFRVVRT